MSETQKAPEGADQAAAAGAAPAKKPAAKPAASKPAAAAKPKHRMETFERERPDGTVVVVERNIDTGGQTVTKKK